mgnify:CR=1 FL=1
MSVEVKLKGIVFTVKSFPKLMIANDRLIVLFNSEETGTAMNNIDDWKIGDVSNRFTMEEFKDYEGEITLKNE